MFLVVLGLEINKIIENRNVKVKIFMPQEIGKPNFHGEHDRHFFANQIRS